MGSMQNCYNTDVSDEEVEKNKPLKKVKFMEKIRAYFGEYCEYTGIHGFKYFGERRCLFEK